MDRPIRRGLVIAGGGAKGAYSFGALKALHESAIAFEAVSATSAGALNGAIWATGQIEAGETLWRRIAPNNAYQLHAPIRVLPRTLARLFFLVVIFFSLGANRILRGKLKTEYQQLAEYAAIFMAWTTATSLFVLAVKLGFVPIPMGYGLPVLAVVFFLFGYASRRDYEREPANSSSFAILIAGSGVVVFALFWSLNLQISVLDAIRNGVPRLGAAWLVPGVAVVAFIVVASATVVVPLAFLTLVLRILTRITTYTSAPLQRTISDFLRESTLAMPFFAAVAWSALVYDPDRPEWANMRGMWWPWGVPIWIPEYIRVDEMSTEARIDVLMASAAIPFGVVKPIVVNGQEYVDGGLADNEPVAPLLQFGLDEIWLLSLDPDGKSDDERRDECLDLLRRPHLFGFDYSRQDFDFLKTGQFPYHLNIHNSPPRVIPYDEIPAWPKIVRLAPSTTLGGAFHGLHFSPKYAARLVDMGYRDALAFVASRRAGPLEVRTQTPVERR
ncbi:patatin-like phospholipase family protein [Burkholderia sp. R-69980]|nr:patatin-like phospholipase family protein [Burkholderia sp. R-69980]